MALEPVAATESKANPELVSMTRRFWVSAALTLPLLAVMVSDILPGRPLQQLIEGPLLGWFEFALATPVVLWGGWPFFERGWASIVHRQPGNMFSPHRHAAAALLYAFTAWLRWPHRISFPRGSGILQGNIGLYFRGSGCHHESWSCWARCWS